MGVSSGHGLRLKGLASLFEGAQDLTNRLQEFWDHTSVPAPARDFGFQ